ncbi:MAG TPA: serine hydrolase [Paenibacillus sp.]|uniref:serine hydrolase domain-containing protein n=1 Tax=Paenibacillus sp. TaxID=58172 RepID=UPI0028D20D82|nr:serine hydrolase [Paenibacillus sp.]HUC92739.1 serine hydrolase [Paenibacillus sp.]
MRAAVGQEKLPEAAPETCGLDGDKLEAMREVLTPWGIKSVLVVKNGRKAWEWHEAGQDRQGSIYSCTKSVLSALIGIAVDNGYIDNVERPIGDYLELGELPENGSRSAHRITIRHLLTMKSGFDWPDFDKPYNQMKKADDWVRYVLDRPVVHEPGEAFTYNSGGSHLLSAILTKTTGQSTLAFAMDKLFGPLGIRRVRWNAGQGVQEGGTGLYMTAADLAKFGLLYARKGVWEGRRIVSADWVAQSTVASTKGLLHYKPPIYGCYGYHWWVSAEQPEEVPDYFFAFGFGGQYLAVAPEEELVAVIRKGLAGRNKAILSRRLLHEYIFAALIGSRRTIPASQSSNEESSPASQAKDVTVRDGKAVRIVQQSVPRA